MKLTIDFYTKVMGMPLVHALRVPPGVGTGKANRGNPPFENLRRYFFDAGNDTLVAFFEIPRGAKKPHDRDAIGAMQHCSFTVSRENFEGLHTRLKEAGVPVIGPVDVGAQTWSLYFFDPNGIRLEYSWQEFDDSDLHVLERWTQTREECLAELRSLSDNPDWLHMSEAMAAPALQERWKSLDIAPTPRTGTQMAATLQEARKQFEATVKSEGLTPEQ